MIHPLGLAHKSIIKMPWAGLCLFLPLPSSSQRGRSFWSNFFCCPFLPPMHPTWSSEGKSGFVALVMYRCIYMCGVNSMCTHLYTPLQLFLGICTGWLLRGLNQRIVALHSSSCACCSCPALSFPELPSLVPSRGLAGPVVEPADPCESALPA